MKMFASQSVARMILLAAAFGLAVPPAEAASATGITNIAGLRQAASEESEVIRDITVAATVCAASPTGRELILADDSGAVLLQLETEQVARPGQRVSLSVAGCQLIPRNWGISLLRPPLVDDDGLHAAREKTGRTFLPVGRTPIRVEWFNGAEGRSLEVAFTGPGVERQRIPDVALASGGAGLRYQYYEGRWFTLPNFHSMTPVAQGVTANFDVGVCRNQDYVALVFTGTLEVASAGDYTFHLNSDDGARLYVGEPLPVMSIVDKPGAPAPVKLSLGVALGPDEEYRWGAAEGIIRSLVERADCLELELESGAHRLRVGIVERSGLQPALLLNSRVRVAGVCRSAFRPDGVRSFGLLEMASLRDLRILQPAADLVDNLPVTQLRAAVNSAGFNSGIPLRVAGRVIEVGSSGLVELADDSGVLPLAASADAVPTRGSLIEAFGQMQLSGTNQVFVCGFWREQKPDAAAKKEPLALLSTAEQVQRLSRSEAEQGWPVLIQGVITCDAPELFYGTVIQDETRGVFVKWDNTVQSGAPVRQRPRLGEFWEIRGRTEPGDFAPLVRAVEMRRLGDGQLPAPLRPTWDQLMSGSLDTQFVELRGIIAGVERNAVVLLTHGGKIRVNCGNYTEPELRRHDNSLVTMRGCLLASWDPQTHLMKPGEVGLASAVIVPAKSSPLDPFTAPEKSAADLLLFDVEAGAFHRVKMKGQVLQERGGEFFMLSGGVGVRFVPRAAMAFKPGTLVEVVGIPVLGGPSPVLREALVREQGTGPLPEPKALRSEELFLPAHDATRVQVEARLVGVRADHGEQLLELETAGRTFVARLRAQAKGVAELEPGSTLRLTGVLAVVGGGAMGQNPGTVELLLDSATDADVIARPPWWTLRRMLAVLGGLVAVLIFAALWITQLRQRVEERTQQLQREIHEREQAERLRQVAEEKSRIARDLHDDLGSSLTEISLLANVAQLTGQTSSQAAEQFGVIASKAHTMVSALDVIVWAVDPEENNLQSLADYVGGYATEFLAASGLDCRFKIPSEFPDVRLDGRIRHELFLAVKEALNNVVRHAQARSVELGVSLENDLLQIEIADDGRGFDQSAAATGHGVVNLQRRLAALGGVCHIRPQPGAGTRIEFRLPLPA